MDKLALENPHPRDARIAFDEPTHVYRVDGAEGYTSVTTLVHDAFPPFVADEVISKMMGGRNWTSSPWFGMTREEIKAAWSANGTDAADRGTEMHAGIEAFYNDCPHATDTPEWKLFEAYLADHGHLVPHRTEMRVWDEDLKIAGSIDMIYRDPARPGHFIVADWKRSKALKRDNRWQKGCLPCTRHLDDCNFNHYSLQLHIYKRLLETRYDMPVSQCFLVILHPSQETYIKAVCRDMSAVAEEIFAARATRLRERAAEAERRAREREADRARREAEAEADAERDADKENVDPNVPRK